MIITNNLLKYCFKENYSRMFNAGLSYLTMKLYVSNIFVTPLLLAIEDILDNTTVKKMMIC